MIRVAETPADLERCVEVYNAVEPENHLTVEQLLDGAEGTNLLHEGDGCAYIARSSVVGSALVMVRVRPEARRHGIGSALLEAAREHARALPRETIWGRIRDPESLAFATSRGFEEVTREVAVLRELEPGDGELAPGIVELADEHLPGAYEVSAECIPEIHVPLDGAVRPYEEWLEHEAKRSPVAFVALDGERVVGYARVYLTGLPHRLEHGLTAVRRDYRRRGLATALKRALIAWAAEHGYRELISDMVEGNAAMRAVNEQLGYRRLPPVTVVSGPS